MSLQDELTWAAQAAMSDAMLKAGKDWREDPALYETATLTGQRMEITPQGVAGELTFETRQRTVPVADRDIYGVITTRRPGKLMKPAARRDPKRLMRKMSESLRKEFEETLPVRLP